MALAMPVKYGPAQLEDAPLPAAVRRLLERLASETGLRTDLEVTGDPLLAATAVDVAVLRLVQGALANVRQHALDTRVVVSLSYAPDELLVDVVDDGSGFDPAATPQSTDAGGFDLRAMRERLAALGGTLGVESAPGEGPRSQLRGPRLDRGDDVGIGVVGGQDQLTEREREVVALLAEGLANRQIARRLFLSEATVKTHLVHVYEKLRVDNRTAAVAAARQAGIIR